MALTVDKLVNNDRFSGENAVHFLLYMPFGFALMTLRIALALILWIASIILPNKSAVRQLLSTLACWTFGVYVKVKGGRDPRCSVLVANYVSCLDSLAASHTLGTISLRKWKVPPFFASTLGIKNVSQFVRKQHFTESPSKPVLLQPEGGPTNGKALLKFTDWTFPIGNRVQPVAITVSRPFTKVTVHRACERADSFPWRDALWFLWSPCSVFTVRALPALHRGDDTDHQFQRRMQLAIAAALQVELTDFTWEEVRGGGRRHQHHQHHQGELMRRAHRVKEVLPSVPLTDIIRDLEKTRSVDITITNFLEGVTPYTPEAAPSIEPQPSTSSQPKYITPAPTGVFPKTAKERQLSFQEKKEQMISEARQRYIEKHGLNIALNC